MGETTPVKERPYEYPDLPSAMEIYTAAIRSLAAPYYSPDQPAAWAPDPPDPERWRERLSQLHTIVAESDGVLAGSLPTRTLVISMFFSLVPLLPVAVLPPGSTNASNRHCVRLALKELRPTPVLLPDHFSSATTFNSMPRS